MCAGDRTLYVDLYSCMEAISKKWFFLSEVGSAAKMKVGQIWKADVRHTFKLVVNSIMGAQMAALAEGMALAERCELDQVTLLEVWQLKQSQLKFLSDLITWCSWFQNGESEGISDSGVQLSTEFSSSTCTKRSQTRLISVWKRTPAYSSHCIR